MKNIWIIIFTVIAAILSSCQDNRLNGLEPDKVYLVKRGLYQVDAYPVGVIQTEGVWTTKSGANERTVNVKYIIDESILTGYNEDKADEEKLRMLPEECFTFSETEFIIGGKEQSAKFQFNFNPNGIFDLEGNVYEAKKYVLPLRIETDGVLSNLIDEPETVLLNFNIKRPELYMPDSSKDITFTVGDYFSPTAEVKIPVKMDFNNPWDISFSCITEERDLQALVDDYNTANGTAFGLLPAEALTLTPETPVIGKEQSGLNLLFSLDKKKVKVGKYIYPVAINNPLPPSGLDPEVDLFVSDDKYVTYVIVDCTVPYLGRKLWTVKASTYQAGRTPDLAIDSLFTTSWHTAFAASGGDNDPWLMLDLGEMKDIYKAEVFQIISPNNIRGIHIFVSETGQEPINNNPGGRNEDPDFDGWIKCGYLQTHSTTNPNLQTTNHLTIDLWTPQRARYFLFSIESGGNSRSFEEVFLRGIDIEDGDKNNGEDA